MNLPTSSHVIISPPQSPKALELAQALRPRGLRISQCALDQIAVPRRLNRVDVVALMVDSPSDAALVAPALERLSARRVATLVWDVDGSFSRLGWDPGELVEVLPADTSLDEVVGRLAMVARFAPQIAALERELRRVEALGLQLSRHFTEMDKEMQLAGALQRQFLPRHLPRVGPLKLAQLYRPATWVSGDLYDAVRIDEQHLGVLVADVIGHGTVAGLITMFVRSALSPKQVERNSYRVLGPTEVLTNIHQFLLRQELPGAQFLTATYATVNSVTRELCMARGGHPFPIHIPRSGPLTQLNPPGSLMGIADVPFECEEMSIRLGDGDKVIFYTDGLEDTFSADARNAQQRGKTSERQSAAGSGFGVSDELLDLFVQTQRVSATETVDFIAEKLDRLSGSLNPLDDISMLVLEVEG